MKRDRAVELRVGLFVMVALLLAGGLAFVMGNQRNFFHAKTHYTAVFTAVGGLRVGSPVRIAGVDVGTVDDVTLGRDGLIHVELGVIEDAAILVTAESLCTIGNKGLLGDKLVDVTAGRGEPLPEGATIRTESPVELSQYMARAGAIVTDVEQTVGNLRRATEPLGDEQFTQDIRNVAHNVSLITGMVAEEDGTARRLLSDPEMADSVEATLENAQATSSELARTARSVRAIVDEVRAGDGSAHELVYGQDGRRLVANLADATEEAAAVMRDVRTGDGMAHDMIYGDTGDAMVDNLTAMTADLRAIVADIRAGRGTIGGLFVDPSIYEDVKRLVGNLERNEILRALVRYSIRRDESEEPARGEQAAEGASP